MSAILALCDDPSRVKLAVKPDAKIHLAMELLRPMRGQTVVPACNSFTRRKRFFSMNRAYGYALVEGDVSEVTCVRCLHQLKKR